MEIDKHTYEELSILTHEEQDSLFHRLNYCATIGGSKALRKRFLHPFSDREQIRNTQEALKELLQVESQWPNEITNGTLMVIEKFYEYQYGKIPESRSPVPALLYQALNKPEYALLRFSVTHFIDLVIGMDRLSQLFATSQQSVLLQEAAADIRKCLKHPEIETLLRSKQPKARSKAAALRLVSFFYLRFRPDAEALISLFHQLDALHSMSKAVKQMQLSFPEFINGEDPLIQIRGLFHPMLSNAVSYDVQFDTQTNFMFLTGANMSGKSTFIKAVGVAVYLAHLGMGVPAQTMQLSLFEGMLTNIQVQDDLAKGESYFFNEVQRIKNTILKISDNRKWLILIDELFKGTNIQDAMQCSTAVINGLLKFRKCVFILSTHLYEIGPAFTQNSHICFRHFETTATDDEIRFSYQLKEGISNERIGYLILKREKVIELLDRLHP